MKNLSNWPWLISPLSILIYLIWIKQSKGWSPFLLLYILFFAFFVLVVTTLFYIVCYDKGKKEGTKTCKITPLVIMLFLSIIGVFVDLLFPHGSSMGINIILILIFILFFFFDRILANFFTTKELWVIELTFMVIGIVGWII